MISIVTAESTAEVEAPPQSTASSKPGSFFHAASVARTEQSPQVTRSVPSVPKLERTPVDLPAVDRIPETVQPIEADDYEIVLGRRQLASVSFVALVVLVVVSALSYIAGKAMGPGAGSVKAAVDSVQNAASAPVAVVQTPVAPVPQSPVLEATIAPIPAPVVEKTPAVKRDGETEAPLFADPQTNAVYIQIGAVEKGIAVLLAEGLRSHGLDSFVAPGPNERVFRVLVGPLPNPGSFTRAKETVDLLGLSTFARKYQK